MTLLTEIRKVATIGHDGKLIPSQRWDITYPVNSVAGKTGNVLLNVTDISGAASLDSPAFIGNPTAPTPTLGDNDSSIATTAFVQNTLSAYSSAIDEDLVAIANLSGTGFLKRTGTNTWSLDPSTYAPLDSPALIGNPTAPTPANADNDTSIATTAFVKNQGYASSTDVNTIIQQHWGNAKAWVYFYATATSIDILTSHNINSITEIATRQFIVHFPTGLFSNSNYVLAGITRNDGSYSGWLHEDANNPFRTSTQVRIEMRNDNGSASYGHCSLVAFGD